jgi:hypothetical protein
MQSRRGLFCACRLGSQCRSPTILQTAANYPKSPCSADLFLQVFAEARGKSSLVSRSQAVQCAASLVILISLKLLEEFWQLLSQSRFHKCFFVAVEHPFRPIPDLRPVAICSRPLAKHGGGFAQLVTLRILSCVPESRSRQELQQAAWGSGKVLSVVYT